LDLASNIKDSRTEEDLLFQVLLDWGVDLTLKIERKDIAGKSVYFVDDDTLAACFEENINEDFVKELAKTQPLRVVFKDGSFASDDVKINIGQIFKHTSVHTDIKVI
jgi:adenine-specific DNA-methyltransferase